MSKLLSQGGFGCIYYPGLSCKGKSSSKRINVVTKLQEKGFTSDNEFSIGEIIKNFSLYKDFFLPVIKTCPIDIRLMNKKLLSECEKIKDSSDKWVLMDIPYIENKPFTEIFKQGDTNKKHFLLILIETYSYLLTGIKNLITLDVVHFDLKENNILYNSFTKDPQIIDFGISIPINKINDDNIKKYIYIYAPEYYIWPLEVHILGFILHETNDELTSDDATDIVNKYSSSNRALDIYSKDLRILFKNACKKEINKYVGKSRTKVISDLIKFYKTWDNCSLSILFLNLFRIIFPDGFPNNSLIVNFSQILLANMNPNPEKRFTIEETISKFNDIFYKDDSVDSYLDVVKNISVVPAVATIQINNNMDLLKVVRNNRYIKQKIETN